MATIIYRTTSTAIVTALCMPVRLCVKMRICVPDHDELSDGDSSRFSVLLMSFQLRLRRSSTPRWRTLRPRRRCACAGTCSPTTPWSSTSSTTGPCWRTHPWTTQTRQTVCGTTHATVIHDGAHTRVSVCHDHFLYTLYPFSTVRAGPSGPEYAPFPGWADCG